MISKRSPGVAYSITVRAQYPNIPGMLGKITSAIGKSGGDARAVDVVQAETNLMTRDFTINTSDLGHSDLVVESIKNVPNVKVVSISDATFLVHVGGKIEIKSRSPIKTRDDMSKAYTPGVGRVSVAIKDNPESAWSLTGKGHTVAVVTDGSAVLGLGDIGPEAALPVMEGKAMLFKEFGGVDAWPLVLDTKDPDEIVEIIKAVSPGFGGINLEDISAPRCFYIEERLRKELKIPVFHDDQHGTAVVVLAGLINALKVVKKKPKDLRVIIAGVGAAGTACARILMQYGIKNIIGYDRLGSLNLFRDYKDNKYKKWFAKNTNPEGLKGNLKDGLKGADMFLGLAGPSLVNSNEISKMSSDAIVFALSNPDPEIWPEEITSNVAVMATGRTDYPNQVNNSLCFPGLFRGVLDVRASEINDDMKVAAAVAIASVIPESNISSDFIIPSVFDHNVARLVAKNVSKSAIATGVARRKRKNIDEIYASFKPKR